ncbi:MAG TPA: hypothetical protein PLF37_08960, partial [Planctomycetota bacterium]|nr:hypothetical protein [Planctomycetota bacterium]
GLSREQSFAERAVLASLPAALFHIQGEKLLPVPFEKDYAFRDFCSLGSTTLVCTYNTKSRRGFRDGKLSLLKGEAMCPVWNQGSL